MITDSIGSLVLCVLFCYDLMVSVLEGKSLQCAHLEHFFFLLIWTFPLWDIKLGWGTLLEKGSIAGATLNCFIGEVVLIGQAYSTWN